ncbi:uroporphyrinogen-III synthase [Actinopolyspora saharensis]|uniref:Uroporphyrinogen-III synthase n=1 Tax=Actinopolyspora saharensis TaxID=995062 RepID=A0A1H1A673_9ACTN|nr:uroporphyrinogen-III synthase [Actinopolyspora saharensis]SDQ34826.1 uroporphyrinogen-III synthase [Actinopolyspora saharensis]
MTTTRQEQRTLTGFTVGTTATRRVEELATMLHRRGAEVRHGPAIRILPLADDGELFEMSESLLRNPPDVVVITTGIGFRGWLEAAEGWGFGAELAGVLGSTRILARGPKATGAVRAAGLSECWAPESESTSGILARLRGENLSGCRVAVQLHGQRMPEFTAELRAAGAEVIEVPAYRWSRPHDEAPLDRLVDEVLTRRIDALVFTSAPAVTNTLDLARRTGRRRELLASLRQHVLVTCVGPVCAAPLEGLEIPVIFPQRPRLGSLVRSLDESLPARVRRLDIGGNHVELRGQGVLLNGELRPVPPSPMALLRKLSEHPGKVLSRRELVDALPNGGEEHAVEMAIGRLRTALGNERFVQTVIKRGYRLALDDTEMRALAQR